MLARKRARTQPRAPLFRRTVSAVELHELSRSRKASLGDAQRHRGIPIGHLIDDSHNVAWVSEAPFLLVQELFCRRRRGRGARRRHCEAGMRGEQRCVSAHEHAALHCARPALRVAMLGVPRKEKTKQNKTKECTPCRLRKGVSTIGLSEGVRERNDSLIRNSFRNFDPTIVYGVYAVVLSVGRRVRVRARVRVLFTHEQRPKSSSPWASSCARFPGRQPRATRHPSVSSPSSSACLRRPSLSESSWVTSGSTADGGNGQT